VFSCRCGDRDRSRRHRIATDILRTCPCHRAARSLRHLLARRTQLTTEETTVFRIAGQNLVHDPEGRPLTNQPLLQLVICVWPSGNTLQHHRPSRKSHRAASSCIGHRNRHWIVSFVGLPNWFAKPNQFNQCFRWPITSSKLVIADPRILTGRQLLLSFLFTTCYRAVHPSIENCTSLSSSVRHFWGTEALMSFAINHELVEF